MRRSRPTDPCRRVRWPQAKARLVKGKPWPHWRTRRARSSRFQVRRMQAVMTALRLACLVLLLAVGGGVRAHVNERGMDYRQFKDRVGIPCCTKEDCHPAEKFVETQEDD